MGLALIAAMLATAEASAADIQAGERAFRANCRSCHLADEARSMPGGPHLKGIVGRKPASAPGFRYSAALGKLTAPWTEQSLNAFLANPSKAAPGTSMMVATPRPADRAAIIAYLRSRG